MGGLANRTKLFQEVLLRTLTDIFTPGSAPLAEALRTLVVSPERFIEPGALVRAMFSFSNMGGGTARAVRVRFCLPEGLLYVPGSACLDDEPVGTPETPEAIMRPEGLAVGDVRSGERRSITLAYTVAPLLENERIVEVQAAICSRDLSVIGSNIVRLIVCSKPNLLDEGTRLTMDALSAAVPGAQVRITASVRNGGESSAGGLRVVVPVPVGTAYVPGSAEIDSVPVSETQSLSEPFGYTDSLLAPRMLAPGDGLTLGYRARIDQALPDGAHVTAQGWVSCAELGELALPPASVRVSSAPFFEGEYTRFDVELSEERESIALTASPVRVGSRLTLRVLAHNAGTAAAREAAVRIVLPENIAYMPGSLRVDGQAFPEPDATQHFPERRDHLDLAPDIREITVNIPVGEIGVGETREVLFSVGITSPAPNGRELALSAVLRWEGGSRSFTRLLSVRSEPRISRARTLLRRPGSSVAEPGETINYELSVLNDGTMVAEEVVVDVFADERIEQLDAYRFGERLAFEENHRLRLGVLEPQKPMAITIQGKIGAGIGDAVELGLSAVVAAIDCEPLELQEVTVHVRARPRFSLSSSFLRRLSDEPLRPGHFCRIAVVVRNEGNDHARDVCVALKYPPEVRLEVITGATCRGEQVAFEDIEPGGQREATVVFRAQALFPRDFIVDVGASMSGQGFLPIVLDTVRIPTRSEACFTEACSLAATPGETVDAGARLTYRLQLRNTGDGIAEKLVVKADRPEAAGYLPASTTVNGYDLPDVRGLSPLWSDQGLVLHEIPPGTEIDITWSVVVHTPLETGTFIRQAASLRHADVRAHRITACDVVVRSLPAFSIGAGNLPFTIAALPARASIVGRQDAPSSEEIEPVGVERVVTGRFAPLPESADAPLHLVTEFSQERLDRTFRFLKGTDFQSLLTHLLVLRSFFPGIADASPELDTLLEEARLVLHQTLDRLFVKARLPEYQITAEDLEDEASREKIKRLFAGLIVERSVGITSQRKRIVRIITAVNPRQIEALITHIEAAPAGSVAPWYALAHLLGEVLEYDGFQAGHIGSYRDTLIEALGAFIQEPLSVFHHALLNQRFPRLEEALGNVLSSFEEHVDVR